jgi:hypothetical protein
MGRYAQLPVFLFICRKDTRSDDDVAGLSAMGQETKDSFK